MFNLMLTTSTIIFILFPDPSNKNMKIIPELLDLIHHQVKHLIFN